MNRKALGSVWALTWVAAAVLSQQLSAAVIFLDTFNRSDTNNIDADNTTGITNNTGSALGPDAVYTSPWIDPNYLAGADTVATNGGGQRIKSNLLEKYNAGTVNMFVNHNFTNASILSAGGFTVSLDVVATSQSTFGQGTAIAVGMSLAEAQIGHDANDGGTAAAVTPIAKFTNAFQNSTFTTGTVLSDFYFALRGDGMLAWGVGGAPSVAAPTSVTVGSKTGTLSASFELSSFAAGSPVNYTVFFNGVAKGSGTFNWSDTDANYIGVDARDSTLVQMDNFDISTRVPEPTALALWAMALACVGVWNRPVRRHMAE
jgi:hypothetical protein